MYTFQDFERDLTEHGEAHAVSSAIGAHKNSDLYKKAVDADLYDHQQNKTINEYVQTIFTLTGSAIEDYTASNNKLSSNFFRRLNTQRNTYLLGNGVSFSDKDNAEQIKAALGEQFDTLLKKIGYYALIHGVAFGFWNVTGMHIFKVTEFVPLWDEETGTLRGGIRFWQIDSTKPMFAVSYQEDGFTKYRSDITGGGYVEIQPKRAYKITVATSEADGSEVIGEDNYGSLPIIPLWGSDLRQSTLVGMQALIDSYDLIRSGFANDLTDVSQIYWIVSNAGGMTDRDLAQFRDRLKLTHIAVADTENSGVTPYTNEVPYNARQTYLDSIRAGIYEDFGGLDVHTVAAGATNDHIDAAYQPMDEQADDYEYQIIEFIQQLLRLLRLPEVTPIFKRNRISNQMEQTQMVLSAAELLDEETVLRKLPFITVDEVKEILDKKTQEEENRYSDEEIERRLAALENVNVNQQTVPQEQEEVVNG